MVKANRYTRIIENIFLSNYKKGAIEVPFTREEIVGTAKELGIPLPKNLGDVIYSFRYRAKLPNSIKKKAPSGREWVIMPAGRSRYCFVASEVSTIAPSKGLATTKIPDATPGIIEKYASNDEQALLAKLRYNRLIDIFTGVACYSLQNHLRTTVSSYGQIETDEVYVGVDRHGIHYVFPLQAKGGTDSLNVVQIAQDFEMCNEKFPDLICRPLAAQFMQENVIALFEFSKENKGIVITTEKHYKLAPAENISSSDLTSYQSFRR